MLKCKDDGRVSTTLEKAVNVAIEKLNNTMGKTLETKTFKLSPSGFSLVIWLGWVLTLSAVTAGILLPLDKSMVVGRPGMLSAGHWTYWWWWVG